MSLGVTARGIRLKNGLALSANIFSGVHLIGNHAVTGGWETRVFSTGAAAGVSRTWGKWGKAGETQLAWATDHF